MHCYRLDAASEATRRHASLWLMLAVAAVTASSLFALLLVASRAPALGLLFPGVDFYRLSLTMHVNLAQVVWFMAFAGIFWSLCLGERLRPANTLAVALAGTGALLLSLSPLLGARVPVMSNYIPVLNHPVFLAGLALFWTGVGLHAATVVFFARGNRHSPAGALRFGGWCAAATTLLALLAALASWLRMPQGVETHALFEWLFWGGGHVWQFTLVLLMMAAWSWLASAMGRGLALSPRLVAFLFLAGALPTLATPFLFLHDLASPAFRDGFTRMMAWGGWITALPLGLWLSWQAWSVRAGEDERSLRVILGVSVALFVAGLLLGAAIDRETTLVTAHYHGTIGAVTLTFMALTYVLLPALGYSPARPGLARIQVWLYGSGMAAMMLGLAWAGRFGAPRKGPGNVQFHDAGLEAVARIIMGLGGTLAVVGILLFLVIVYRSLWPALGGRVSPVE